MNINYYNWSLFLDNTPVLRWNSTGITVAGISGSPGSADNQLNLPYDIFLDYANNLYIADRNNHRIQKFLFGSSIGQTVAGNVTAGSSSDKLSYPGRVLIDSNENLYITDTGNSRIQFWRKGANFGTTIAGTGKKSKSRLYSSKLLSSIFSTLNKTTLFFLYITVCL